MLKHSYIFKFSISIVVLTTICFSSAAFAFSIIIINDTGVPLRIDLLEDNCGNVYIAESAYHSLAPGESINFDNVMPIVHHYKMCANGTCEGSAIGMKISVKEYVLRVTLKNDCICVTQKPSIWPGTIKCKEAQYEI